MQKLSSNVQKMSGYIAFQVKANGKSPAICNGLLGMCQEFGKMVFWSKKLTITLCCISSEEAVEL